MSAVPIPVHLDLIPAIPATPLLPPAAPETIDGRQARVLALALGLQNARALARQAERLRLQVYADNTQGLAEMRRADLLYARAQRSAAAAEDAYLTALIPIAVSAQPLGGAR